MMLCCLKEEMDVASSHPRKLRAKSLLKTGDPSRSTKSGGEQLQQAASATSGTWGMVFETSGI